MLRRSVLAAIVMIAAVALGGCSVPGYGGGNGGSSAPKPTPAPGLESAADGKATAYGWVRRQGLEGGFLSLVSVKPGADVAGKTVVVLLSGKVTAAQMSGFEGSYVRATGRMSEGVNIRMAGSEMQVDGIEKLAPPK